MLMSTVNIVLSVVDTPFPQKIIDTSFVTVHVTDITF